MVKLADLNRCQDLCPCPGIEQLSRETFLFNTEVSKDITCFRYDLCWKPFGAKDPRHGRFDDLVKSLSSREKCRFTVKDSRFLKSDKHLLCALKA